MIIIHAMYCKSLQIIEINDVVTSTIKTQLHITTVHS